MRPFTHFVLGLALVFSNTSCSVNILSTFADKTTDEALYWDANDNIKNGDYDTALSKIGEMSTAYQATSPVLRLKASAYGGKCGVNFFDFVQALAGMGSTLLFQFLLANFKASSGTAIDNCKLAHDTLISIGSISQRTSNDNFMIAVFGFAKVGQILSYYADKNQDGVASGTFNSCTVGTTRTNPVAGDQMTDLDARELGTGLTLAATNLAAVAGTITAGSGALSTITTVCASLPPGNNFCSVTDPTAFTANEVKGIRSLVKEDSAIGLGADCNGDINTCNCP